MSACAVEEEEVEEDVGRLEAEEEEDAREEGEGGGTVT